MRPRKPIHWEHEGKCIRCITHALNGAGYPSIMINGAHKTIARWILIRRLGEIPTAVFSRHTCDHPWCINPQHIIPGTHADNMRDASVRHRHPQTKLSDQQVIEIRKMAAARIPQNTIAALFHIDQGMVSHIHRGKARRHIL